MSVKLEPLDEEGTLGVQLKALDVKYKNAILFLEQSRQESLHITINKINHNASECRQKIDSEYKNEREIIQQKLFKSQMESYLNTHHQSMHKNVPNGKRKIKDIMNGNNNNNNNNSDNEEDSDVIIMESPPPKKQKLNDNHQKNKHTNKKQKLIQKKSRFEESENDGSSLSESELNESFKKNKKRITNTNHRKKNKQIIDDEYFYENEQETETETDSDSDYNENNHQKRSKSSKKVKLNQYYSQKQKAVTYARKRFKQFKIHENGKIIITLPISTVCTEYAINTIFVTNFGKIPNNPEKADKYCDAKYIYPIGFKAYRIHLSYKDPGKTTKYFMKICDNGMNGPIYEVYAQDDKKKKMRHTAATGPWQIIIDKISKKAKKHGTSGNRETNGTSGPRYLGLRDYLVMGIVELLSNSQKCKKYWNAQKHKHNLPPKPFFSGINRNDIMIQKQK